MSGHLSVVQATGVSFCFFFHCAAHRLNLKFFVLLLTILHRGRYYFHFINLSLTMLVTHDGTKDLVLSMFCIITIRDLFKYLKISQKIQ